MKPMYLYFQTMSQIQVIHPGLHKHFMNGLHVIRKSNLFCAGLFPDLVIEQVLMHSLIHSLKTSGGLTRGCGIHFGLPLMPLTA